MSTSQTAADKAISSLEAASEATRAGFACLFSSSDEYEQALIAERRAAGRYPAASKDPLPLVLFGGCVAILFVTGLSLI